ncbi:MAG: hypothetical protein J6Y60_09525, partial [Treponema sp.]|nr:hypothetical protein [Treponema sp.]
YNMERRFTMNTPKTLTDKEIAALKKRTIDFSDIPELTDSQAKELYPKKIVKLFFGGLKCFPTRK